MNTPVDSLELRVDSHEETATHPACPECHSSDAVSVPWLHPERGSHYCESCRNYFTAAPVKAKAARPTAARWCVRERPMGFCVELRKLEKGSLQRWGAFATREKAEAVMRLANRAEEAGKNRKEAA